MNSASASFVLEYINHRDGQKLLSLLAKLKTMAKCVECGKVWDESEMNQITKVVCDHFN